MLFHSECHNGLKGKENILSIFLIQREHNSDLTLPDIQIYNSLLKHGEPFLMLFEVDFIHFIFIQIIVVHTFHFHPNYS